MIDMTPHPPTAARTYLLVEGHGGVPRRHHRLVRRLRRRRGVEEDHRLGQRRVGAGELGLDFGEQGEEHGQLPFERRGGLGTRGVVCVNVVYT